MLCGGRFGRHLGFFGRHFEFFHFVLKLPHINLHLQRERLSASIDSWVLGKGALWDAIATVRVLVRVVSVPFRHRDIRGRWAAVIVHETKLDSLDV
jgi:hypothetical protein